MNNLVQIKQLIRSKRRTLGLEITEHGELIVRAPKWASVRDIENLLRDKNTWIIRHQQDIKEKLATVAPKKFVAGEKFLFLGEYYCLAIVSNVTPALHFDNGFYLSVAKIAKAEKVFYQWYCQQALQKITERVQWYAHQYDFIYKSLRLNNAKKQWGSCSADGKLSFTWRLIMAPLEVLDYVVVHELVHTKHNNHSKRFWQKVLKIMPNYKQYKKWLKDNDHLLRF